MVSQSAPDGCAAEFVCKVEGNPRPQITWFRQTAIIKPSQDFQIYYADDNKATLVIKEVFPEDAGTFTCVAKNCVGYASSSAELVVQHPLSEHGSLEKHDRWVGSGHWASNMIEGKDHDLSSALGLHRRALGLHQTLYYLGGECDYRYTIMKMIDKLSVFHISCSD